MAFTLFKHNTNIDFMRQRYLAYGLSILLLLIGLGVALIGSGIKLGIDFAGGVIIQVGFEKPIADEALKTSLNKLSLPGFSTQSFGNDGKTYLLRCSLKEEANTSSLRSQTEEALAHAFPDNKAEFQRMEVVGPKVGDDLTNKALAALFYAVLLISVYISWRFEQRLMAGVAMAIALWGGMYLASFTSIGMGALVLLALAITIAVCFFLKLNFAFGAVIGLLHDVGITLGIICLLGVEIDLNVVAALLTILGYSLNDTIIVYDRLRENLRGATMPLDKLINFSVNQTLSRTVITSVTTLFATLALYFFGGGVIHDFALTMLIGVIVGTYSSIYVSSAILLVLGDTESYSKLQEVTVHEKPGEHGIV